MLRTMKLTGPRIESDVVKHVVSEIISRGECTLAPGVSVDVGTVLAQIDGGDGTFVPINFAAEDGSENPAAIAIAQKPSSTATQPVLALRRLGAVSAANLIWPDGATQQQVSDALKKLEAFFIFPVWS